MTLQFRKPNSVKAGVLAISLACTGTLVFGGGVAGAGSTTYTGATSVTSSNGESLPVSEVQNLSGAASQGSANVGSSTVLDSVPAGTFSAGEQLVIADSQSIAPPAGQSDVASVFIGIYNDNGVKMSGSFSNPITVTIDSSAIKAGDQIQEFINGTWTVIGTATTDGSVTVTITDDPVIAITTASKSSGTTTSPAGKGTSPASSSRTSETLLTYGASSATVKTLQTILNGDGAKLVVDGVFGPKTLAAVKAFQAKHHLVVDGIVGPLTWKALQG
jgi:hypothetical protein